MHQAQGLGVAAAAHHPYVASPLACILGEEVFDRPIRVNGAVTTLHVPYLAVLGRVNLEDLVLKDPR
jgi:hypothetical protein